MTIQDDLFNAWAELKEHGDIKKICSEANISQPTVQAAFKTRKASMKTIEIINNYFSKKKTLMREKIDSITEKLAEA